MVGAGAMTNAPNAALLRSDATAIPLGDNTVDLIVTTGDGIDRERIIRLLGAGDTPEGIASGWATDPFGFPAASEPVLVGPDTAGHYAALEAKRQAQMADQAPVDPLDGLAGLRAAREALRKQAAS